MAGQKKKESETFQSVRPQRSANRRLAEMAENIKFLYLQSFSFNKQKTKRPQSCLRVSAESAVFPVRKNPGLHFGEVITSEKTRLTVHDESGHAVDAELTGLALIIQDFLQIGAGSEHGERPVPVQAGLLRETGENIMAALLRLRWLQK